MSDDWLISQGAGRPSWEPVRLNDWSGERKIALDKLFSKLSETRLIEHTDSDLALLALLTCLYRDGTVTVRDAKLQATRLATAQMRERTGRKCSLRAARRDDIMIAVGAAFARFTAHNFPLNEQPDSKEQEG